MSKLRSERSFGRLPGSIRPRGLRIVSQAIVDPLPVAEGEKVNTSAKFSHMKDLFGAYTCE